MEIDRGVKYPLGSQRVVVNARVLDRKEGKYICTHVLFCQGSNECSHRFLHEPRDGCTMKPCIISNIADIPTVCMKVEDEETQEGNMPK